MTKKLLISATALCALSASASNFDGWHGGVNLGYANVSATGKTNGAQTGFNTSAGGFMGGVFVGYNHTVCDSNWVLGLGGSVDHITSSMKVSQVTHGALDVDVFYKPFLTFSLYGKVGYVLSETLMGYGKLAGGFAANRYHLTSSTGAISSKATGEAWTITPSVGLQGALEGNWSWHAEVGYRMHLHMAKVFPTEGLGRKAKVFMATAGLTYKF